MTLAEVGLLGVLLLAVSLVRGLVWQLVWDRPAVAFLVLFAALAVFTSFMEPVGIWGYVRLGLFILACYGATKLALASLKRQALRRPRKP